MKIFTRSAFFLLFIGVISAQEIIYDTTHTGTNAATSQLINETDGPNTHYSDEFIIAGNARLLTSVAVDIVVDAGTENLPYDLTISLHRRCPEGNACGSNAVFYIDGTEQTQTITPETTAKQTITFNYPEIDISNVDELTVSLTANRSGVRWVRNETAVVGSQNTTGENMEPPTGFFGRCGSQVSENNNCTFLYTVGTSVHAITVTATEPLSIKDRSLEKSISLYVNQFNNTVSLQAVNNQILLSAELYNLSGRKISNYSNLNEALNIQQISSGVYFLKIKTNKGVTTKRFIKQ